MFILNIWILKSLYPAGSRKYIVLTAANNNLLFSNYHTNKNCIYNDKTIPRLFSKNKLFFQMNNGDINIKECNYTKLNINEKQNISNDKLKILILTINIIEKAKYNTNNIKINDFIIYEKYILLNANDFKFDINNNRNKKINLISNENLKELLNKFNNNNIQNLIKKINEQNNRVDLNEWIGVIN